MDYEKTEDPEKTTGTIFPDPHIPTPDGVSRYFPAIIYVICQALFPHMAKNSSSIFLFSLHKKTDISYCTVDPVISMIR